MSNATALRISATAHGINYLPEYHAAATGLFAKYHAGLVQRPVAYDQIVDPSVIDAVPVRDAA